MKTSYYVEATQSENCLWCRRWLVRYPLRYLGGTGFDLAGKAGVTCAALIPFRGSPVEVREGWQEHRAEPITGTAVCLRWRCRLRRWLADRQR